MLIKNVGNFVGDCSVSTAPLQGSFFIFLGSLILRDWFSRSNLALCPSVFICAQMYSACPNKREGPPGVVRNRKLKNYNT